MAKIQKFNVVNSALFLGLFGLFMGLLVGILLAILSLMIPAIGAYKIWEILLGVPISYGIGMFISGLILFLIVNLVLKIIKGWELEIDLTNSPSKPVVKVKSSLVKTATPKNTTKVSTPAQQTTSVAPKTPIKQAI